MAGDTSFGALLRRYRRRAGLSQEELAARSFVSARAVSDLERGVNARPRRVTAAALADGLGLDGIERDEFERHARVDDAAATPSELAVPPRSRPPLTVDSFVDDGLRVRALRKLLADRNNRVVTLIGAGGIGKSRLALEAIAEVEGPVAYVALAPLEDPSLLAATIADVLDAEHGPTRTHVQSIVEHVGAARLLLVLDNVEQLTAAAGDVAAVVRACPGVTVLATSRVPLRITGELRVPVAPLATAGPDLIDRPDVRLFLERAASSGVEIADEPAQRAAVAELCARLNGVPLAIELAAARVAIVPPREMLGHLDQALDLLRESGGDRPVQQRSMRATLAWSVRLLPPPAQRAFAALGAFAASASTDAASAVWGLAPRSMPDFVDLLQTLADAHLVVVEHGDPAGPRVDVYETTRQFAREQLEASGQADVVFGHLCDWALDLVERAEDGLMTGEQLAWLDRLERELPNLRLLGRRLTASPTADDHEASLRLAAALQRFWDIRSRWAEGATWLREALARPGGDAAVRAKAHKALGVMYRCLGDLDAAEVEVEQAIALNDLAGDVVAGAACLNNQGIIALDRADYARAATLLGRALALCDALGEDRHGGLVLNNLGLVMTELGELRTALRLCRRSREVLAVRGNVASQCWADDNLASVLTMAGHPRWAVPMHERTVRRRLALGDEIGFTWSLEALAGAWTGVGETDRAGRTLGFVAAHRGRLGTLPVPHLTTLTARRRDALVARVGEAQAARLWEEGYALDPAAVRAWFAE